MTPVRFFDAVKDAPIDQIMGLDQSFRDDPSPQKYNLVVGVFQDEHGRTPILASVKAAERRRLQADTASFPCARERGRDAHRGDL